MNAWCLIFNGENIAVLQKFKTCRAGRGSCLLVAAKHAFCEAVLFPVSECWGQATWSIFHDCLQIIKSSWISITIISFYIFIYLTSFHMSMSFTFCSFGTREACFPFPIKSWRCPFYWQYNNGRSTFQLLEFVAVQISLRHSGRSWGIVYLPLNSCPLCYLH